MASALALPAGSLAQTRPGLDCNLFGPTQTCEPYLLYPPGGELRATFGSGQPKERLRNEGRLETLRDLFAALRACWHPPDLEHARPGMDLTIRFSFKRDGNILGKPRFTYVNRAATREQQDRYRLAVVESLMSCTPLQLAPGLGGAIAGRPIVIRFIDNRNTRTSGL